MCFERTKRRIQGYITHILVILSCQWINEICSSHSDVNFDNCCSQTNSYMRMSETESGGTSDEIYDDSEIDGGEDEDWLWSPKMESMAWLQNYRYLINSPTRKYIHSETILAMLLCCNPIPTWESDCHSYKICHLWITRFTLNTYEDISFEHAS